MEPIDTISRVGELLSVLDAGMSSDRISWFRGQSNVEWKLLPSLARFDGGLERELHLLARFKQNAALLVQQPSPVNEWEWLTVMQHYQVPTRLLDWTESPLVALFFAIENQSETDGSLWILDPERLNRLSNVSGDNPLVNSNVPSFGDEVTQNYQPSFVAAESYSHLNPIAVIGPRNTARMQAQLGVFTVIHREPTSIEDMGDGDHILKYRIPREAKEHLSKELSLLSIGRFQLFPELQSLGELLTRGPT